MADVISLSGPVESLNGGLVLMIPLDAGGSELAEVARGIGVIDGEFLRITIPQWLAKKFGLREGSMVSVNNLDGKFNILPDVGNGNLAS